MRSLGLVVLSASAALSAAAAEAYPIELDRANFPLYVTADGLALVDAQLDRGALVIAEGVQPVREGQAVELVETRPRAAAPVEPAGAQ